MDILSEIEAKFDAEGVEPEDIFSWPLEITGYKVVSGWDKYYQQGSNWLRHRCDGNRKTSVLTCKVRKSESSIADRHEVDLPVHESVDADTVEAFLKLSGWKLGFEIQKKSYIFQIKAADHSACLAIYDVWQDYEVLTYLPGPFQVATSDRMKTKPRRFLEIEIEKDSVCSHDEALEHLKTWVKLLQARLPVGEPLNQSLFEMFGPQGSAIVSSDT